MDTPFQTREFKLSRAAYRRLLQRKLLRQRARPLMIIWLVLIYWFLSGISVSDGWSLWTGLWSWSPYLLLLIGLSLWLIPGRAWRIAASRRSLPLYQSQSLSFDESGITQTLADGSRTSRPYSLYRLDVQSDDLLQLEDEQGRTLAIPRLAFEHPEQIEQLLEHIQAPASQAYPTNTDSPLWPSLKKNLLGGLKLVVLRRPATDQFSASADQLILLLAVSLFAFGSMEYLLLSGAPEFSAYGLMDQGLAYLLLLIAVYLAARLAGKTGSTLLLAVVLLSTDPFLSGIFLLHGELGPDYLGGYVSVVSTLLLIWLLLIWWNCVRLALNAGWRMNAVGLAILFGVIIAPQTQLPETRLWYAQQPVEEDTSGKVNVEDLYYAQPDLLNQSLEEIAAQRPGIVDLYHIGFGGYAPQAVFRREVNHVRSILDQNFDTLDRSLVLINDQATMERTPIASASNLRLALQGIAERMDPDEDVLLLFLTSHGSRNAELTVSFPRLGLNQLSAAALRRMLDDAGIGWRVLVISACYSGSFVDILQDERTLLITASAKDRTSFGCSNENEYTYFGEAYFKQALQQTHSFIQAYELAEQSVEQREKREGLEPSQPTLFVGARIEDKLRQLEARLQTERPAIPE